MIKKIEQELETSVAIILAIEGLFEGRISDPSSEAHEEWIDPSCRELILKRAWELAGAGEETLIWGGEKFRKFFSEEEEEE